MSMKWDIVGLSWDQPGLYWDATFNPVAAIFSWVPDFNAKGTRKPKVATAGFGDGYSQRAQYGINVNPQIWALQFVNRDVLEAQAIDSFLTGAGGVYSFKWTPPDGSPEARFICQQWDYTPVKSVAQTVTATFMQVFES